MCILWTYSNQILGYYYIGMCDIYNLWWYCNCCFNNVQANSIEHVTHFGKNKHVLFWEYESIHCMMKPIRIQLECPYNSSYESKKYIPVWVFVFYIRYYIVKTHKKECCFLEYQRMRTEIWYWFYTNKLILSRQHVSSTKTGMFLIKLEQNICASHSEQHCSVLFLNESVSELNQVIQWVSDPFMKKVLSWRLSETLSW